jgi:hypothetical protein
MTTPKATTHYEYDHSVTSENTVPHWVIYALDAIESEHPEQHRDQGNKPEDVWDYASDEDGESLVFRSCPEVRHQMKQLATERGALERRTDETGWHESDVDWYYRLSEHARNALLDLGVPEYLPNRRDPEFDRGLPMEPSHEPGWWLDDTEDNPDFDVDEEWDLLDNDWITVSPVETDKDGGIFYKDNSDAEMAVSRGYTELAEELHEAFPDVTFVMTCGPYRTHDLMYRIRDPFRKVVQIDVYSPMAIHRETEEITESFESLVHDLHHALESAAEDFDEWEEMGNG